MAAEEPPSRFADDPDWLASLLNDRLAETAKEYNDLISIDSNRDEQTLSSDPRDVSIQKHPRPRLILFDDLQPQADAPALIEGLMDRGSIAGLVGPPGSTKTFLALDWAESVATGTEWRGRTVYPGGVLYVATEGRRRFSDRVEALRRRASPEAIDRHAALWDAPLNLLDDQSVTDLIDDARTHFGESLELVVIDTFSQATPGGDENSAKDMTRAIAALQRIRDELGTAVLFVHHTGKSADKGARGFSGIKAAVDTELTVSRDGDVFRLKVSKQRDGEIGLTLNHRLQSVGVGAPEQPRTSCVLVPLTTNEVAKPVRAHNSKRSERMNLIVQIVEDLRETGGGRVASPAERLEHGIPSGRDLLISHSAVEAEFSKRSMDSPDSKDTQPDSHRRAFNRLAKSSEFSALIGEFEGYLWIK